MTRAVRLAALFALIALWPAIVSGGALWFPDLAPYVRGGHVAFETVGGLIGGGGEASASTNAATGGMAAGATAQISGVRSVAYSVLAYLAGLGAPRFWLLAALQAGAAGALLAALIRAWGGPTPVYAVLFALGGGPVFASTAGPDVWAGLMLLGAVVLAASRESWARWTAAGVIAFAVAAHASHVPLGLGLALVAFASPPLVWPPLVWPPRRVPWRARIVPAAPLAASVAAGLCAVLATSLVGFGQASLVPARYPIVLARGIEDGPALWHLEARCETYAYAVCEVFPDAIPDNVGDFLWNEGGVRDRATPAQLARIRAEEAVILRRAGTEYPWFQVRRSAWNVLRQAGMVAQAPALGRVAAYEGEGRAVQRGGASGRTGVLAALQGLAFAAPLALLAGCLALAALGLRVVRMDALAWSVLALTVLGLLGNAAICGALSVPEARYQARIAWVLPLVAAGVLARARKASA